MTGEAQNPFFLLDDPSVDDLETDLRLSQPSGPRISDFLHREVLDQYDAFSHETSFIIGIIDEVKKNSPKADRLYSEIIPDDPEEVKETGPNISSAILQSSESLIRSVFGDHVHYPHEAFRFTLLILSHFPEDVTHDVLSGRMTLEDAFELKKVIHYNRLIDVISQEELDSIISYLKLWTPGLERSLDNILGPIPPHKDFTREQNLRILKVLKALSILPTTVVHEIQYKNSYRGKQSFGEKLVRSYLTELNKMPPTLRMRALNRDLSFEATRGRARPFHPDGTLRF